MLTGMEKSLGSGVRCGLSESCGILGVSLRDRSRKYVDTVVTNVCGNLGGCEGDGCLFGGDGSRVEKGEYRYDVVVRFGSGH